MADPDVVHVLAVGHRLDDVGLGDDAYRPPGVVIVEDDDGSRAGTLHWVRGGGQVGVLFEGPSRLGA